MKNKSSLLVPWLLFIGGAIGLGIAYLVFQFLFVYDWAGTPVATLTPAVLPPTVTPLFDPARLKPVETLEPVDDKTGRYTPDPSRQISASGLLNRPAPDFDLKTLDGGHIRLSDLAGKPVLINVWASWCVPCRTEMPRLQAAYEKYKNAGLTVLGLNLTSEDSLPDVQAFVSELQLTFPILLDETGRVSGEEYGVIGLPTSYFLDRSGIVRALQLGEMLPEEIEQNLQKILSRS